MIRVGDGQAHAVGELDRYLAVGGASIKNSMKFTSATRHGLGLSGEDLRKVCGMRRVIRQIWKGVAFTALTAVYRNSATKLIKISPFRSEPRAVKRRPKNHQLLNAPRHEYVEDFHRPRYFRKAA